MKKFFALMLVVAMLSVAGSAMAVTPTLRTSNGKTEFTVPNTKSETVTLTAAARNGGTVGAIEITGAPAWVSRSGNTLTLTPPAGTVTSGQRTFTFYAKVTETVGQDIAGHSVAQRYTANLPISVTVIPNTVNVTQVITRIVTTVVEQVKRVVVPAGRAVQQAMSVKVSIEETKKTTVTTITETVSTIEGFDTAAVEKWTAAAATIGESQDKVAQSYSGAANAEAARTAFNLPTAITLEPVTSNDIEEGVALTTSDNPVEVAAAAASNAGLTATEVPVATVTPVKATKTGVQQFPQMTGKPFWGKRVGGSRGTVRGASVAGSFSTAADDTNGIIFLNSAGTKVDFIPGELSSDEIMPGYVNMMVVVEAGQTYAPVMYTTTDQVAGENTSVDVNTYTTQEEKVIVKMDANGGVGGEVVIPQADTTVTNNIKNTIASAISGISSADVKEVPDSKYGSVIMTDTEKEAEKSYALSYDVGVASQLGMSLVSLDNGVYYIGMTFEDQPSKAISEDRFVFYPDGYSINGTTARAWVLKSDGVTQVTRFSDMYNQKGYLVFQIVDGAIRTSDTNATLDNPTLTVKLVGTPTPPAPVTYTRGTESSGGGCSAGSAALALAVLGSFIFVRKK